VAITVLRLLNNNIISCGHYCHNRRLYVFVNNYIFCHVNGSVAHMLKCLFHLFVVGVFLKRPCMYNTIVSLSMTNVYTCNLKRSRRTVIVCPACKISSLKITPPKTPNSGQFSYQLPNIVSFLFRLEFRFRSRGFFVKLFSAWQPYC
jgi:hypothetical protein